MEVRRGHIFPFVVRYMSRMAAIALLLFPASFLGQQIKPEYVIDEGRMIIKLDIHLPDSTLNNFIRKYNLRDLDLTDFIRKNLRDTLVKKGWKIEQKANGLVTIYKQLNELKSALPNYKKGERPEQPEKPEAPERAEWIQMTSNFGSLLSGREGNKSNSLSGANRFITARTFRLDSITTFYLAGHQHASKVYLAGDFTNWQHGKVPMQKMFDGWAVGVKLGPGKYFYKFIVDNNWMTDGNNLLMENDGEGNDNSVFYKPNKVLALKGFLDAKRVVLSGSFNNWAPDDLIMERTPTGWQAPLYLSPGTYTYRFVVDGKWMVDPANKIKVPNEFNDFNSFIAVGNPYVFKLSGYSDAKEVILSGSFNDWQSGQLRMLKTASGWELPYTLGPGNYEYKFIVDGKWINDPGNPLIVNGQNSYLILAPNHTFHLKGFADAKKVYLAGDFDSWSSNTLQMTREGNEWIYSVFLSPGKHLYKFVVDGNWKRDPANPLWEDQDNSIVWEEQ